MVTVSYNTRHLIARLLFGLRCVLNPGVVVTSTDGSRAWCTWPLDLGRSRSGRRAVEPLLRLGDRSSHHTSHFGHAHGAALAATFETADQAAMADDIDRTIVEVLRNSTV